MTSRSQNVDSVSLRDHMHPQTTGRAPGTADAKSIYSRYLGAPNVQSEPNPLDEQAYVARDLPDVYKNKRVFLQDTIEGFILDNFEWYTFVIPWFVTNEMHVEMNIYRYNHVPAGPTPNKGISRLITDSTSVFSDSVQRFGLAFMMEGDHMGTPEGDVQYMRSVMGISQGCQELVNQSTVFALLAAKNYYREWQERNRTNGIPIQKIMQQEVDHFAILAEVREGLDKIVEDRMIMMRRERAVPDSIIVFPGFPWHETMIAKGTFTEYYQTGPDGVDILLQGPRSFGTWRDLIVYQTREFHTHNRGRFVQPLIRSTCVGEVYPLTFGARRDEDFKNGGFETRQRNCFIYNIDTDQYEMIEWKRCLQEARLWHGNSFHPKLLELLKKRNAELRKDNGAFEAKAKRYSDANRAALDMQPSTVAGSRTETMLFSHDVEKRELFMATHIGMLDVDVMSSGDLHRIAQMMLNATISKEKRARYIQEVQRARSFFEELERAGGTPEYWRALVLENASVSVDAQGRWVGERTREGAPRDFVPNSFGSLDLPQKSRELKDIAPAGFANYPGIKTIAAQAVAKGWTTNNLAEKATAVAAFIDEYTDDLIGANLESALIDPRVSPDWFHLTGAGQIATTEFLFGKRPPVFLHVPSISRDTNQLKGVNVPSFGGNGDVPRWRSGPADAGGKQNVVVIPQWLPVPTNQYNPDGSVYLGAVPTLQWITLLTEANNDVTRVKTSNINRYFEALSRLGSLEDFKEKEAVRNNLISSLRRRLKPGDADPVIAYYAARDLRELIFQKFATPPATIEDAAALAAEIKPKSRDMAKMEASWRKEFDEQTQQAQEDIVAVGTKQQSLQVNDQEVALYNAGKGQTSAQGEQTPLVVLPKVKTAAISSVGLELATEGSAGRGTEESAMTRFADALNNVEQLGRKWISVAQFSWKTAPLWAQMLVESDFLDDESKEAVTAAMEEYGASLALMKDIAARTLQRVAPELVESDASSASGMEMDDDSSSLFLETGAATSTSKQGERFSYFRAPLTNSEAILRAIADQRNPEVLPADPETGFRTPFNPSNLASGQNGLPGDVLGQIFERGEFARIQHAQAREFEDSSLMTRYLEYPHLSDEEQGVHDFVAAEHLRGGYVETGSEFSPQDESSQFKPRWNNNAARFGAHAARVRKVRQADGSYQRTLDRTMAQAHQIEQQQKRARLIQQRQQEVDMAASRRPLESERKAEAAFEPLRAMQAMQSGALMDDDDDIDLSTFGRGAMSFGQKTAPMMGMDAAGGRVVGASAEHGAMNRGAMPYRWKQAMKVTDPLLRVAMLQIMYTPLDSLSALSNLLDRNVNLPFNCLLWRLWIEIEMYTLILMRSGMDTGANVIGNTNFSMQTSTIDKVFLGHFTFYHKTMIWREQNISHLLDIFPRAYKAGWNTEWIVNAEQIHAGSNRVGSANRKSLIATLIPITENEFKYPLSFVDTSVDRLLPAPTNRAREAEDSAGYSMARYYGTEIWKLSDKQVRMTEDNQYFQKVHERVNVLAYLGVHVTYNVSQRNFTKWTHGNGHCKGNKTGHGARSVWMGKGLYLFPQQSPSLYQLG